MPGVELQMKRWRLPASRFDDWIARAIARHTSSRIEKPLSVLTLAADERLLLVLSCTYWLGSRGRHAMHRRRADHLLLTVGATAVLPHLMKGVVAQERPDRAKVHGQRHGIPHSGKTFDAFPSGHAMHMGALAAAMSRSAPRKAPMIWAAGSLIAATRIVLLAHWTTDVLAGLMLGAGLEHLLHSLDSDPR
jgi:membrane-associated phospholipid phosphatase